MTAGICKVSGRARFADLLVGWLLRVKFCYRRSRGGLLSAKENCSFGFWGVVVYFRPAVLAVVEGLSYVSSGLSVGYTGALG